MTNRRIYIRDNGAIGTIETDAPVRMKVVDGSWIRVGEDIQIDGQQYRVVQKQSDTEFDIARIRWNRNESEAEA